MLLLVALSPRARSWSNAVSFGVSARDHARRHPRRAIDAGEQTIAPARLVPRRPAVLAHASSAGCCSSGGCCPPSRSRRRRSQRPTWVGDDTPRRSSAGGSCALPLGVIVGDLVGVWGLTAAQQRRLIAPIAALAFVPYVAFLLRPPVPVALPLLVVAGLGAAYFLGLDGLVRDTVARPLFARTMAINNAGLMTIQGLGFAVAGAFAQVLPPYAVIAGAGVCGLITVLLLRPVGRPRAAAVAESIV